METKLHELHALQAKINVLKADSGTEDIINANSSEDVQMEPVASPVEIEFKPKASKPAKEYVPFLWVGEVSEGSPAYSAGLQTGDAIVKFDDVTVDTEGGLKVVAEIVN